MKKQPSPKFICPFSILSAEITNKIKTFSKAKEGLAAIEFAILAPLMVFLFLATIETSDALSTSRRVTLAVNTMTDLVAQELQIDNNQLDDLFTGVEDIIDQGSIAVDFNVVSLIVDPSTNDPVVHWSRSNSGGTPYAPGSPYTGEADVALLDPSASLIIGEVSYAYSPVISHVAIQNIDLEKVSTRWPRRSFRVQHCVNIAQPATCTN